MLQIILDNCFDPDNSEYKDIVNNAELPFHDNNFNKTMELIRAGDINKLCVFPISHANRLKEEFLDNVFEDGYPCSDKLNIMLTSKSGIEYFVVDGRCFPDEDTKKDSLVTKNKHSNKATIDIDNEKVKRFMNALFGDKEGFTPDESPEECIRILELVALTMYFRDFNRAFEYYVNHEDIFNLESNEDTKQD